MLIENCIALVGETTDTPRMAAEKWAMSSFTPGRKIDKDFDCDNRKYNWQDNPHAFYKKLLELNRKRKQIKGTRR